jgi:hypothetical protein
MGPVQIERRPETNKSTTYRSLQAERRNWTELKANDWPSVCGLILNEKLPERVRQTIAGEKSLLTFSI